jgi:hypothetical protein
MRDGLPSGGGQCRLVHSVGGGLAGSGTSSNVQWQKGTEREKEALVPVRTHVDQSTRRIELSLKKARS